MEEEIIKTTVSPSQPEVVTEIPKKNLSMVILLVILGLLVVAGAVYAAFEMGKKQISPNVISEPTVAPQTNEVSSTPDETGNWKTYTNDKFGFEFKYPNDWIVNEEISDTKGTSANLFRLNLKRIDQSQDKMVIEPEGKPEYPYYSLSVIISNENYYINPTTGKVDFPGEEVVIGGIKGFKFVQGSAPCGPTTTSYVNYTNRDYGIEYTPCSSRENGNKFMNEYDQILSTFKFTN